MFFFIRKLFFKNSRNTRILPSYLWLAKKSQPPQLTSLVKIESILNIKWMEDIQSTTREIKLIKPIPDNTDNFLIISSREYGERLKELYENCIIRWLDTIGWVVTLRPGKTLKKGYLCCYAGLLKTVYPNQYSSYESREYFFSLTKTEQEEVVIDAKHHGNIARLFPFLIEKYDLDNFDMHSAIKNEVATANLQFQFAILHGRKIPCVFVPEDITAPNDQEILLGLSYSLPYLYKMQQTNNIFKLINKNTFVPIDTSFYQQKIIQIQLIDLSYSFPMSRFRIMIGKSLPHLIQKTIGFDEEKQEYYEITLSNADLYNALMQDPTALTLHIRPNLRRISSS